MNLQVFNVTRLLNHRTLKLEINEVCLLFRKASIGNVEKFYMKQITCKRTLSGVNLFCFNYTHFTLAELRQMLYQAIQTRSTI